MAGLARRYLWRYRWPLAIAAGLELARTLFELARPWPISLAIDSAIGRRPPAAPWDRLLGPLATSPVALAAAAGAAIVALAATAGILGYLATYLTDASAERVGADLREDLHARLVRLSLRFHQRQRTGDLTTRLTGDVGRVQDALVAWLASLAPQVLTLAGIAAVLVAVDPLLALAALAALPPLGLVVAERRRRLRDAQHGYRDRQGALASTAAETIRGVRLVQAFCHERGRQERFREGSLAVARSGLDVIDLGARYLPTADLVLAAGAALVLWVGVARVLGGHMTVGTLVVALTYVAGLHAPVRSLTRLGSVLGKGAASARRLTEILDCGETVPERAGAAAAPAPRHEIALRSVTFAYVPGRPVLRGVDLRIPAGATLCVVGPTGAGKSTLLGLLLRLFDPDSGAIEIDGTDLRSFGLRSVRELAALVPQEADVIDATLLENIALGRPEAAEAELLDAARIALLDGAARALPDGYRSRVGEGGAALSGGQRRCLAIARALVRRAPLLLLDEPTTGLDVESEAHVMAAIRRAARGRTVVVVSHHLALSARAGLVAVLEGGRIVEQGPPAALLSAGGAYARTWGLQRAQIEGGVSDGEGTGSRLRAEAARLQQDQPNSVARS